MQQVINFLILTTNANLFAVKELCKTIKLTGHNVSTLGPDQVDSSKIEEAHIIINRNTGLNYRDDDLCSLENITGNHLPLISNSNHCSRILRDKYKQWSYLKEIISGDNLIDTFKIGEFHKAIKKYPKQKKWILKTLRGQQAKGVKTSQDLQTDAQEIIRSGDDAYIIQPYFPLVRELRVLIIKSIDNRQITQYLIEKRPKELTRDFHVLNFKSSLTKSLPIEEAPSKVLEITRKVIDSNLGFNFISIDFLESEIGEIKLLEINSCPGLEGAQRAMNEANLQVNIGEEYIKQLISVYYSVV